MKLSIALCAYNGAQYLTPQLESIAAQTRSPDELIICDDHSSDATPEIIAAFARRVPFPVRWHVNERNLGSTQNFAQAIERCTGEIIALSDQDDVWHAEKLRRIEEVFLARPEVGLVFSDAELVDEQLRPLPERLWQHTLTARERQMIDAHKAFDALLYRNVVTGATMAFRARFKPLILPIPTDFYLIHDGWIAFVVAALADVAAIAEPLIKYRQHPQQQLGINLQPAARRESRLKALREERARYYADEVHKLKSVRERLLMVCDDAASSDYRSAVARLKNIDGLTAHYLVRGRLPEQRLRRWSMIYREVRTRRYRLYSNGLVSAAVDLLR